MLLFGLLLSNTKCANSPGRSQNLVSRSKLFLSLGYSHFLLALTMEVLACGRGGKEWRSSSRCERILAGNWDFRSYKLYLMIWSNVLSFNWPSNWLLSKSIYRLKDAKAKRKRMGLVIKELKQTTFQVPLEVTGFFRGLSTYATNLGSLNSLQHVYLCSSWSVPARQINFVDCPSWSHHWLEGSVAPAR